MKKKGEEKENEAAAARVHDQRDELLQQLLVQRMLQGKAGVWLPARRCRASEREAVCARRPARGILNFCSCSWHGSGARRFFVGPRARARRQGRHALARRHPPPRIRASRAAEGVARAGVLHVFVRVHARRLLQLSLHHQRRVRAAQPLRVQALGLRGKHLPHVRAAQPLRVPALSLRGERFPCARSSGPGAPAGRRRPRRARRARAAGQTLDGFAAASALLMRGNHASILRCRPPRAERQAPSPPALLGSLFFLRRQEITI